MRDEGLAVPFGWLSLSSYQWLPLDLVPGSWSADATGATSSFEVWDSVTTLDGDPVHGTLAKSLHEGGAMHFGSLALCHGQGPRLGRGSRH